MRRFGLPPEAIERLTYPETMLFLGSLATVLALVSLVVRVRATYRLDLAATLYLQRLETPFLAAAARTATFLGNATTVLGLAVLLAGALLLLGRGPAALLVALSLLSMPLNAVLKNIFDRERPGEREVRVHGGPRWGFSYPSGHSMVSAAFYGTLATIAWLLAPSDPLRYSVAGLFVLVPIACGVSRIYLGAHWLSDVVAGWTGGALVALYAPLAFPSS